MRIEVVRADYHDPQQAADIVFLLNAYAIDPMGGGEPLSARVKERLVSSLAELPHASSLLCYVDGRPAGLVNCFEGFSTFSCKKVLNVHDIAVLAEFRGQGLGQLLLAEVEALARDRGCGKITLEVLEGNVAAQAAYRKFGFDAYQLDPALGRALFWQKSLLPAA